MEGPGAGGASKLLLSSAELGGGEAGVSDVLPDGCEVTNELNNQKSPWFYVLRPLGKWKKALYLQSSSAPS